MPKLPPRAELGDFKSLEKLYQANWIDEWYKDKKQKGRLSKKGRGIIEGFFLSIHKRTRPTPNTWKSLFTSHWEITSLPVRLTGQI